MDGWQPIETAPKDGRLFDVWCVHPESFGLGVRFTDVGYRSGDLGFIRDDGDWENLEKEGGVYPVWMVTHWAPLPAPPHERDA